jgi:hypothetical protein
MGMASTLMDLTITNTNGVTFNILTRGAYGRLNPDSTFDLRTGPLPSITFAPLTVFERLVYLNIDGISFSLANLLPDSISLKDIDVQDEEQIALLGKARDAARCGEKDPDDRGDCGATNDEMRTRAFFYHPQFFPGGYLRLFTGKKGYEEGFQNYLSHTAYVDAIDEVKDATGKVIDKVPSTEALMFVTGTGKRK